METFFIKNEDPGYLLSNRLFSKKELKFTP